MQHLLQNNYDVNPNKRDVDSPFFLSSTNSWDVKQLLINNKDSMELLKFKTRLMVDDYPTAFHKTFIIDGEYKVNFIDHIYLKAKYTEYFGKEPQRIDPKDVTRWLQDLPLTDRQRQVLMSVCKTFLFYEWGIIEPLHQEVEIDLTHVANDLEAFLVYALKLDFKTCYKICRMRPEHIEEIRQALTDIVTKKFIDHWYINPALPNQYIPILAFQNMKDNTGNQMVLSIWQAHALYNYLDKQCDWNFVATDRQSGKTFLSAWIAFIELLKPQGNDVVYVVVDENAFEQPFTYFKRLSAEAEKFWVFEFKETQKKAICPLTGNRIIFVLGWSKMWVRGKNGKVFIFDEAWFIKDETFKDSIPVIATNEAKMRALSTINWKQRHEQTEWFYKYLIMSETMWGIELEVSGEKVLFPAQGIRVTIDDVEWKSPVAVAMQKDALKDDPDRYYAELYATMPTAESSILPKGFFVSKTISDLLDEYICWHDPAKKKDTGGAIVFNMTRWVFVDEARMQNMTFLEQIKFLKEWDSVYHFKNVLFDRTWVWEAVYELGSDIYTTWFIYTSGQEVREKHMWCKTFYVPKSHLVDCFVSLADEQKIQALMSLKMFAWELWLFWSKKTKSGNTQYEATVGTDDLVNAAFLCAFFYAKRIKYENFMMERQKQNEKRNLDWEVESWWNAMQLYIKRLSQTNGYRNFGI